MNGSFFTPQRTDDSAVYLFTFTPNVEYKKLNSTKQICSMSICDLRMINEDMIKYFLLSKSSFQLTYVPDISTSTHVKMVFTA